MEKDTIDRGKHLQLAIYSLAAREIFPKAEQVRAAYWFATTKGGFKRLPSQQFDLGDPQTLERFRQGVTTISDGIRGGAFPANPGPPDRNKKCQLHLLQLRCHLPLPPRPTSGTGRNKTLFCLGTWNSLRERRNSRDWLNLLQSPRPSGPGTPSPATCKTTLFIEASAGTGKTTSLVNRVVNMIATGTATLDKIAAITFTEAAAAELRERIREELENAAADCERSTAERDRCQQGISDLDQSAIQTLHAFAALLLHERPLEARLPPSFEVSDEMKSGVRFNEEWDKWLDEALEDPSLAQHISRALTLGLTWISLRT